LALEYFQLFTSPIQLCRNFAGLHHPPSGETNYSMVTIDFVSPVEEEKFSGF